MNIFLIPSWYPESKNYVQGIFIKEQFEALARFYKKDNFIISTNSKYNLPFKKPGSAVRSFWRYKKSQGITQKELLSNLFEINNSALTWSEKLKGEITMLIKSTLENFLYAKDKFGNMDLIHSHVSYPAGFIAMELKRRFNIPYVITEHMAPFPFKQFVSNGQISKKISDPIINSNRVIAVSSFLSNQIKSYINIDPVVIPNMVNENLFFIKDHIRRKDKLKFLTVSSLIESKGIEDLMPGILKSIQKRPDTEFVIAGSGHLENFIIKFIERNNISDRVSLFSNPSREEVIHLFQDCDVFISPSRIESFGIVFIEAMACGKPVIAADSGGPADFVREFNGRLIPVNSPEKICEAIEFFVENISMFSAEKIREFIMENYSQKVLCREIMNVYSEMLRNNSVKEQVNEK